MVQENNYQGKFKVRMIFELCIYVFDYKRNDLYISTLVFVKGYGLLDRKDPLIESPYHVNAIFKLNWLKEFHTEFQPPVPN